MAETWHSQDYRAQRGMDILIGADKVVRVNIDGACALRVQLGPDFMLEICGYCKGLRAETHEDGSFLVTNLEEGSYV